MGSDDRRAVEMNSTSVVRELAPVDAEHQRRRLEAEQAAAAYWRSVAETRRSAAASVQHRPLVRAAIAVDRRSSPLQERARAAKERLRATTARAHLRLLALRTLPALGLRRRRLHTQILRSDRIAGPNVRTTEVLVVDLFRAEAIGASSLADRVQLRSPVETVAPDRFPVEEINRLVERCRPDAICVLAPHAVPRSTTWIQQLTASLSSEVSVAVPTLVHPERPGCRTPHDLLTRSRGLTVRTVGGFPLPLAAGAGEDVDIDAPRSEPTAATATCALIDGDAWRALGGLAIGDDPDAAVIDLCIRIRASGRGIRNVPSVLVADWRPVAQVTDLAAEVRADSSTWRSLIERHGPVLRRSEASAPLPCSITVTTAVPSAKLTDRWGDWPFASSFADALRKAGHPVLLQTLDRASDPAGRSTDVHVVIRGLAPVVRTPGQRHVLWVISHPESVTVEEYDSADLVLVASSRFADHVRTLTTTPVEVFLQATDPDHFRLRSDAEPRTHEVLIVANSRGVMRRSVADAEGAGLAYSLVGSGWEGVVPADRVVATRVGHDDLPGLYGDAEVVLNDHWDTMAHWGFVSNRVLDVLACGTPVASDHLPELEQIFGDLVPTWSDPRDLAGLVEDMRSDPTTAHKRALAARDMVLENHTFDRRARDLIELLARHDLLAGPET